MSRAGVLPKGTLTKLEKLLAQAKRISAESTANGRAIAVELKAVADAINNMQQVKLPLAIDRVRRVTSRTRTLTEKEWEMVLQIRCRSKEGRHPSKQERALTARAFDLDPDRYGKMDEAVFNATVPFGSNVRWPQS
jgi:hypothetical protein